MGDMIEIGGGDEIIRAYRAGTTPGPALIVLHEYWGLGPHIESVCDRFAAEGFVVLAPDLFGGATTTDPDEAATLMQALNIAETERRLARAVATLLSLPESASPRAGIVGFCMGGQLALYAATVNPMIGACVDFYGIHPKVRPVLRDLHGPLLGIFAEYDAYTPMEAVTALDAELTLLEKPHDFHTFPGTHHAFFNDARPEVYDRRAADQAWRLTVDFFRANLT